MSERFEKIIIPMVIFPQGCSCTLTKAKITLLRQEYPKWR